MELFRNSYYPLNSHPVSMQTLGPATPAKKGGAGVRPIVVSLLIKANPRKGIQFLTR